MRASWLLVLSLLSGCAHEVPSGAASPADSHEATPVAIALPGGEAGIGFDDLQWSPELGRMLAPAGRTGALDLVDPATGAVQVIGGFGGTDARAGGHGDGCTSAVFGDGWLFAIDRSRRELVVADPQRAQIVARTALAAGPDYVRWIAARRELWVTEPSAEQIEIFSVPQPGAEHGAPQPAPLARLAVPGGPESLVIDASRGRAFTHTWKGETIAIDLATHALGPRWSNGCTGSRGIALDEARGWLFVGCEEGRASVLDVEHEGRLLGSAPTGEGVDIISYDATLRHLYVPAEDGTLTLLGVAENGSLSVLQTLRVAPGAQGVVSDGRGHVLVGDPAGGRLLLVRDELPATR
jgi:hypothetical protein